MNTYYRICVGRVWHSLHAILATAIVFCVAENVSAQDQEFLYFATVTGEDAVIRSGPGPTHYGTDRLAPGDQVQVYRHDPGGWMAIRPPEGSFSLVQRNEVEILENGLARVTAADTVAWVGTKLNPVDTPMWQVKLRAGELLLVLGQVDREVYELGESEPDWLQVAAPAGEFRWIASRNIRKSQRDEYGSQPSNDSDLQRSRVRTSPRPPTIESRVERTEVAPSTSSNRFEPWDDAPSVAPNVAPSVAPANRRGFDRQPIQQSTQQSTQPHSTQPSFGGGQSGGNGSGSGQFDDWSFDIESDSDSQNDDFSQNSDSFDISQDFSNDPSVGWKPARNSIVKFSQQRSRFIGEEESADALAGSWNNNSPTTPTLIQSASHQRSDIFDATDNFSATPQIPFNSNPSGYNSLPQNTYSNGSSNLASNTTLLAPNLAIGNPQLQALDIRLSQEMLKPPEQWQLVDMAAQAQRALDSATNQQDVDAANRILKKLRKCREIQAGYQATDQTGPVDLEARRLNGSSDQNSNLGNNVLGNYDAYGYLNVLVRNGGLQESTFVLQDETGRITHHVAAQPGVNLRRYLKQPVGIVGNRGFHQGLQMNHVSAERIVPLDRVLR